MQLCENHPLEDLVHESFELGESFRHLDNFKVRCKLGIVQNPDDHVGWVSRATFVVVQSAEFFELFHDGFLVLHLFAIFYEKGTDVDESDFPLLEGSLQGLNHYLVVDSDHAADSVFQDDVHHFHHLRQLGKTCTLVNCSKLADKLLSFVHVKGRLCELTPLRQQKFLKDADVAVFFLKFLKFGVNNEVADLVDKDWVPSHFYFLPLHFLHV